MGRTLLILLISLTAAGCVKPKYGIDYEHPFGDSAQVVDALLKAGYTEEKVGRGDRFLFGSVAYTRYAIRQNDHLAGYVIIARTGKGAVVGVKSHFSLHAPLEAKSIVKTMWEHGRNRVPNNDSQFYHSKEIPRVQFAAATGNGLKGYWMKTSGLDVMWLFVEKGRLSKGQIPAIDLNRLHQ